MLIIDLDIVSSSNLMDVCNIYRNCGHIVIESFQTGGCTFNGYIRELNDFRCDYSLEYIYENIFPKQVQKVSFLI